MSHKPTDAQVEALSDAMWQILDDMGEKGLSCCGFAKAQARVAYEPFRVAERAIIGEELICEMSLSEAERIVYECENGI